MLHRLKMKFSFVFTMLHVGLGLSVFGLYKFYSLSLNTKPELIPVFWFFAAGTACLYGGVLAAVAFMYAPVSPWVQRVRRVMAWREWVAQELPALIAALPALIAAIVGVLKTLQAFGDQIDSAAGKAKRKGPTPAKAKARAGHKHHATKHKKAA